MSEVMNEFVNVNYMISSVNVSHVDFQIATISVFRQESPFMVTVSLYYLVILSTEEILKLILKNQNHFFVFTTLQQTKSK